MYLIWCIYISFGAYASQLTHFLCLQMGTQVGLIEGRRDIVGMSLFTEFFASFLSMPRHRGLDLFLFLYLTFFLFLLISLDFSPLLSFSYLFSQLLDLRHFLCHYFPFYFSLSPLLCLFFPSILIVLSSSSSPSALLFLSHFLIFTFTFTFTSTSRWAQQRRYGGFSKRI